MITMSYETFQYSGGTQSFAAEAWREYNAYFSTMPASEKLRVFYSYSHLDSTVAGGRAKVPEWPEQVGLDVRVVRPGPSSRRALSKMIQEQTLRRTASSVFTRHKTFVEWMIGAGSCLAAAM